MLRALLLLAVLALASVSVRADNYAVIVAGSNTYGNYRHQADVCHAYKLLRKYGVPEANIITVSNHTAQYNTAMRIYVHTPLMLPTARGNQLCQSAAAILKLTTHCVVLYGA